MSEQEDDNSKGSSLPIGVIWILMGLWVDNYLMVWFGILAIAISPIIEHVEAGRYKGPYPDTELIKQQQTQALEYAGEQRRAALTLVRNINQNIPMCYTLCMELFEINIQAKLLFCDPYDELYVEGFEDAYTWLQKWMANQCQVHLAKTKQLGDEVCKYDLESPGAEQQTQTMEYYSEERKAALTLVKNINQNIPMCHTLCMEICEIDIETKLLFCAPYYREYIEGFEDAYTWLQKWMANQCQVHLAKTKQLGDEVCKYDLEPIHHLQNWKCNAQTMEAVNITAQPLHSSSQTFATAPPMDNNKANEIDM